MNILLTRRTVIAGGAAAFAVPPFPACAATVATVLSPDAMRADIALLRRAYEMLHPGLLRYNTPAQSAARFATLANSCARPMTLPAFYLRLSRFLATVQCGHSYANFYNQSRTVQAALFDAPDRLPLSFLWLGPRMIVTADPFATGIVPGSEVLAIDGRPAGEVLAALMTMARADGGNDGKRRRLMSVQGEDGYESFDIFFSLLFGGRTRYRLLVADPAGRRRTAVLEAVSLAQRRAHRPRDVDTSGDRPVWTIERHGSAALLTMPTWAFYNTHWDWAGWLNEEIDRLCADRVPRLIVDLRGNEGGNDCGNVLAARLLDHPTTLDTAHRLVRYRRIPPDLRPALDTWDRRFDDWGDAAQPFDSRYLELTGARERWETLAPRGPRYTGAVTVLTDAQNSSATFAFAQLARRERLATLVGEPTGGNRRGINGGGFYFLRLPATGLEVDLPLIGTFPRASEPNAGIVPDRRIAPTIADITTARDPVIAALL
ncbi:S41 family peptidase [Sphingomonas sp.]|uniref:S41 family peptidase n=1 Tax=Sphingomonas sp. TaxID=28214 RepID=UPI003CC59F7B